ncbi:hypothetical protein N0V93_004468 [Gnomoniopsis smithogilvyi]|uniref:5'-nucleotidase n=1 Tax=Gnomoniopsis smithogilvyi TaxID=1191159 RepID=A0A9W8YUV7_9PEZI|nr:hypothetical protein N0V93_004468 [Gnomoniopsis smithogilvyi]
MWSTRTLALTSLVAVLAIAHEDELISQRAIAARGLAKRGDSFANDTGNFELSFYHINDVHAHFDEFFATNGNNCTDRSRGCVGGYARVKTTLDQSRPTKENSLFLDAGDEFQGTLFYNFYKGEKTAEVLNQIGVDAMTLGNHEFDDGDDVLGEFLANLTFPIVSANIRSSHPVLNRTIQPYTIFDQYKVAVIGVTVDSSTLSNPSNLTTFSDPIRSVQDTINTIHTTTDIKRIVALTHIGYDQDILLAQQTTGLSLIMGGHSHTPLGNMSSSPAGAYPTIVNNTANEEVFVVTAYRWGEYLGYIDLVWDSNDRVVEYHGAPFHLDNSTAQDAELQRQIVAWRAPFEEYANEVIGESSVDLGQDTCQLEECLLGDLMADAAEVYGKALDTNVDFAIINAGGIRAAIDAGPITRGEVLTAFPFGNSLVSLTRTGQEIWTVLEGIVSGVNQANGLEVTSFLQLSSSIRITYSPDASAGSRLQSVIIGGQDIDLSSDYTIITLDYLATGGDNFFEATTDLAVLDLQADVLEAYIAAQSPIAITVDGRIEVV